jgi:dihydroorotate dehydrogenase electron transfer subunit
MPGAHLLWLESPQIASSAQPGQFVMVRCGEDFEYPLRRPFSLHQREGGKIALLFNIVGKGTQWLSQRQSSDELDLLGPLGKGFTINAKARKLLLLAGGIGIAPLYYLASSASKKGHSVKVLLGARTTVSLYLKHCSPIKATFVLMTEDGSEGEKGIITDVISKHIDWADQLFACGPLPMYKVMAKMPNLSKKPVQISLEVRMGCGQGICYGCTVKTRKGLKQVCQDGPVFELNDILWEEIKEV